MDGAGRAQGWQAVAGIPPGAGVRQVPMVWNMRRGHRPFLGTGSVGAEKRNGHSVSDGFRLASPGQGASDRFLCAAR